ncbi:MAG TPA: hypothetical protein VFF81_03050 [Noviherbaspirillum sp.]|nr:hypothetical protein [Noviherbaspirillum sp.]
MRLQRILAVLAAALCVDSAIAMQQALLIQNSGWMEPFYTDTSSQLKPLVYAAAGVIAEKGDVISVLSFNQSTKENNSPSLLFQGSVSEEMRQAINGINVARKGAGKALADTDFNEAVFKTIVGAFKKSPGILWIFTNNKNSPNNSSETAERNREFYKLIHSEPSITRSLAFPLSMPVKGSAYSASGLMIYALAYGAEADQHLQRLVASNKIKTVLTQQPAQLKPLDREAVRLVPKSLVNAPNTSASLGDDGRTLFLDIDISSHKPAVQLVAAMENMFYPYTLNNANISAKIAGNGWEYDLPVSPQAVQSLKPAESSEVVVTIPLNVELPNPWSPSVLLELGKRVVIPSKIGIRLDGQQLKVNDDFIARLGRTFPGDPLPDVFLPPQEAKSSLAEIPLLIRINYPLYPLIVSMAGVLALVGAFIFMLKRSRAVATFSISVDGVPRRVSLSAFSSIPIFDGSGKEIARIGRKSGAPTVESVQEGHSVSILA